MFKKANTAYLLRLWLPLSVIILLLAAAMANVLLTGTPSQKLPVVFAIVFTAGMMLVILRHTNDQYGRLLKQPGPYPLVKWLEGNFRRMPRWTPNGDLMRACSLANIYAYYGDFAAAHAELEAVDWDKKAPAMAASGLGSQVILAFLEKHDYPGGLALAQQARQMAESPRAVPGAKASLDGLDALVHMGEALTQGVSSPAVAALEARLRRRPNASNVIFAWALATTYAAAGHTDKAREKLALIRALAPYCRGLTTVPGL